MCGTELPPVSSLSSRTCYYYRLPSMSSALSSLPQCAMISRLVSLLLLLCSNIYPFPSGQISPDVGPTYVVDLGPQRPQGQFPPGSGPVDLGPQRPQGQFPPGSGPVDLGPQRPQGQFPPGSGPVDLGPQRPQGQFRPEADPVETANKRPVDLGPHRPAGQIDPNGPKGSNSPLGLGPHRPQGPRDPNLPLSLQASAYYQVGETDLGPQRPSGQFPPTSILSDHQDDNQYRVHWNVPTFMCHRYGFPFSNLSGHYGLVQNDNDVFRGSRIAILYDPGLFPALIDNDGEVMARNGGVPQEGNLDTHLQMLRQSIEDQVPEDFDGLGVIDFEAWRPVWGQNFGTLREYQTYSVNLERNKTPTASDRALQARARQRFEAAAKLFFLRSLQLTKELRPNGRWGYYAFPYCFNSQNYSCSDNLRSQNTQIQWLFDASTALFPSVYLSKSTRDANDEFLFIAGKLNEAQRVARGRNIIYPYLWYRYRDAGFLSDDDLRSCLALPRALGMAGSVVWGSSSDMNNSNKCQNLNTFVVNRLGPTIRSVVDSESDQEVREYVRQRNATAVSATSQRIG